jgi:hypothetical protein
MMIRHTSPPAAVTQPAHAWLAGQIGRAWGTEEFPRPPLFGELVFATEQHDVGYLNWELAPTLDRETGVPHVYKTLPCEVHLELWRQGIQWMLPASRFTALIISLHSSGLYQRRFDWENAPEHECRAIRGFLDEQQELQRQLIRSLGDNPRYAHLCDSRVLEDYTLLVGTWDLISLHLCEAGVEPLRLEDVPARSGGDCIHVSPFGDSQEAWWVEPWPFREPELELQCECRTIHPPYQSEEALRADLQGKLSQTLTFRLSPAR